MQVIKIQCIRMEAGLTQCLFFPSNAIQQFFFLFQKHLALFYFNRSLNTNCSLKFDCSQ